MTQRSWKTPVIVVADDFTGANDAGSSLAQAGARVQVLFSSETPLDVATADVWAISTDSRAASADEAAARTADVVRRHKSLIAAGWLFKKIDSTLRGNIGAEVRAAQAACGKKLALIVPAVPRLGRVTRSGVVEVNGVALTDTEYASDPKTPVISARVLTQLGIDGCEIDLATLRSDRFPGLLARLQGAVVIDAECESDIARIMAAAAQLAERPLLVGAAGLSDALGAQLAVQVNAPVLAVIGSMSAIAQQQVARLAQQRDITLVDIDIRQWFTQPHSPNGPPWAQQAVAALREGQHTVIRTCQHAGQRHEIEALCQQHQVTRQQLGEAICAFLGELTLTVCRRQRPAGLYLSGGDVAIAVAQALGASGFQIQGVVAGCVPHGFLLNSEFTLPVMTKAGGFGDENTLVDVIRFIEEKSSE